MHARHSLGYFVLRRRPPSIRTLTFLVQAKVMVPVLARPFASQSHFTFFRTDIYVDEQLGIITNPVLSEATRFPRNLYLVCPVHFRSPSENETAGLLMREFWSACSTLNRRPPQTFLSLAKLSLWRHCELLGQKGALERRHPVPEAEVSEAFYI